MKTFKELSKELEAAAREVAFTKMLWFSKKAQLKRLKAEQVAARKAENKAKAAAKKASAKKATKKPVTKKDSNKS
jgi:hypothetical protein